MGEQVAGQSWVRIRSGWETRYHYRGGIDHVASGQDFWSVHGPAWPCRSGISLLEGADERLPWFAETKTHLSVHFVGMELNFNGLPNDAIHVLGLSGEDGGIMKLNVVSQFDIVLLQGRPWRWRRYIPPKRRFTQELHGATSQKTAFFIVTSMKTSNLSYTVIIDHYYHSSYCCYCWFVADTVTQTIRIGWCND
jgi:hypothetical protein